MISILVTILLLWLVAKYVPYGDIVVAIIVCAAVLKWLGVLPAIIWL